MFEVIGVGAVRYRMTVEYRGTHFHGFQRQPDGLKTVQGSLEEALGRILGSDVRVQGAGRTDAGVHARGQVIGVDLPGDADADRIAGSLNSMLAPDISVLEVTGAPGGFDPRRDAKWREYRYFILRRHSPSPVLWDYSYHHPYPMEDDVIEKGTRLLTGIHDMEAFSCQSGGRDCTREVLVCAWERTWCGLYSLRLRANAFLYRMARVVTGALLELGRGRMTLEELDDRLKGGEGPCCKPLPARGLFLWEVGY